MSEKSIIEAIPLATGNDLTGGWIVSPNFLLEIKSHIEGDDLVPDLEEIEQVVLALNRLQAKYRMAEPPVADARREALEEAARIADEFVRWYQGQDDPDASNVARLIANKIREAK